MRFTVLCVLALALLGLSFAPRGVEVTIRNQTAHRLTWVRADCRGDTVDLGQIEPGESATGALCPTGDTSIRVVFTYRERPLVYDLRVYTHADAVGRAEASLALRPGASSDPVLVDVSNESGYSLGSLIPSSLFTRGVFLGLAVALFVAGGCALRSRVGVRRPDDRDGWLGGGDLSS